MTKILIIEGPDNVGKDTLINNIIKQSMNPIVFHAGVPDSSDLYKFYEQGIINNTISSYKEFHKHDIIIHNRSIYGEFVYGHKYRQLFRGEAASLVYQLEYYLKNKIDENDLYFVLLTSDNASLLSDNDDGKSLSNANEKDIKDEIKEFDTIFKLSEIKNKKRILVNNGNTFKDKNEIFEDVYKFINNK